VRWRDRYHLFFQYNPADAVHADICWGHVSSRDLVRWEEHPVALAPRRDGPDAAGCWSGCCVVDGDDVAALYTGAHGGPDTAAVCLARSRDDRLDRWRHEGVVAREPDEPLVGFRDPFVFVHQGRRYGVVGAGRPPQGRPALLLYDCADLASWRFLGTFVDATDGVAAAVAPADVWECPQLFRVDQRWVLLVSMAGQELGRTAYLVGDLVTVDGQPRFVAEAGGLVDHGHDFYAPAVLVSGERVLMWGWTWEDPPCRTSSRRAGPAR
jgi:beta-fructofuranosidase